MYKSYLEHLLKITTREYQKYIPTGIFVIYKST